ncbi:MAG: ABC transporter permease, partial [Acidobacteriota bacterium]
MFLSYIKTAFRNLRKYKGYSFINIAGLAVGIACCILILLWVQDELSYDGFHDKADRLHRVVEEQTYAGGDTLKVAVTPAPLAPALKEEFPEIEAVCRYTQAPRFLVRYGENQFYESGLAMADPPFLTMFSFPLVKGDPAQVFRQINSMVLSESMVKKYFGDEDPIGKTLRLENMFDLIVTGVMEDVPENSHLQFDSVMPFKLLEFGGQRLDQWGNNSYYTYIELTENADPKAADQKIRSYISKHLPESTTTLHLQPIRRIHLHSDYVADFPGHGDIRTIFIFSLTAFLVLVIACINFVNLATARSGNRAREVGMRKVTGAHRGDLIRQFLGESVIYALLAFVLALGLTTLVLPAFGNLAGKTLTLGLGSGVGLYPALIALALLTGLGAGLYPALYLSRFNPVRVLKGSGFSGPSGKNFRRVLVVFQFALSIGLIIVSLIIQGQLNYIRSKPLGFQKENVVFMRFGVQTARFYEAFKTATLSDPSVLGMTSASEVPTQIVSSSSGMSWQGKDPNDDILFNTLTVTHDFFETLGMKMAEGRPFSREFPTDLEKSYIVNETAARLLGSESPVGKPFTMWSVPGNVVGVVRDFHFSSLNAKVSPLVIRLRPVEPYTYLLVRLGAENTSAALERL